MGSTAAVPPTEVLSGAAKQLNDFAVPKALDDDAIRSLHKELIALGQQSIELLQVGRTENAASSGLYQNGVAERQLSEFRARLVAAQRELSEFLGGPVPGETQKVAVRDRNTEARETLAIVNEFLGDLDNFHSGTWYQQLRLPHHDLEVALPKDDTRTPYRALGVDDRMIPRLFEHGVSLALAKHYADAGMTGLNYENFLAVGVPAEKVSAFLATFSPDELLRYREAITSPTTAATVAALCLSKQEVRFSQLHDITLELQGSGWGSSYSPHFVDKLFGADGVKDVTKNGNLALLDLLHDHAPQTTNQKILLGEYRKLGLSEQQVLCALKVDLTPAMIRAELKSHPDIFRTGQDVFLAKLGNISDSELRSLFKFLPVSERSVADYVHLRDSLPNGKTIQDTVPYLTINKSTNLGWADSIPELMRSGYQPKDIAPYLKISEGSFRLFYGDAKRFLDAKVPASYVQSAMKAGLYPTTDILSAAYREGVTSMELASVAQSLGSDAIRELTLTNELAPFARMDKAEQKKLLPYVNMRMSVADAQLAMHSGVDTELADFLRHHFLDLRESIATFGVSELQQQANAQKTNPAFIVTLGAELQLRKGGFSADEAKELAGKDFPLRVAIELKSHGESWRDYQQYAGAFSLNDSPAEINALRLAHFVGLSASQLATFASAPAASKADFPSAKLDIAINKALHDNALPRATTEFLHHYNLNFPSRYPVDMLIGMTSNYSNPDQGERPQAIILATKSDHNSAFDGHLDFYDPILKNYNTYIYEVSTDAEWVQRIQEQHAALAKRGGKEITLVVAEGHGTSKSLQLSTNREGELDSHQLDLTDADLFAQIDKAIAPDAQFILIACNTGEGGKNADNLATFISHNLHNREVFAPKIAPTYEEVKVANGRILGVTYRDTSIIENDTAR